MGWVRPQFKSAQPHFTPIFYIYIKNYINNEFTYQNMGPQKLLIGFLVMMFLLGFSTVSAAELGLTHDAVKDTVAWDEAAVFTFYVQNNQVFEDTITVRPSTDLWADVRIDNPVINVAPNSIAVVTGTIRAPNDVRIGSYDLEILAISGANPDIKASDIIRLSITTELPHVDANFGIPGNFEPGILPINIVAKNTGAMPVSGLTGVLESALLPGPVQIDIGSLDVNEARLVWEHNLDIPLNIVPGNYNFKVSIYQNGEKVSEQIKRVDILGKENLDVNVVENKGFLSTAYTVAITNIGNVDIFNSYDLPLPAWEQLFVQGKPSPGSDSVTGALFWSYSLAPGETANIYYKISYLPILAALIATLIVLYALGWYYRQEFSVSKELGTTDQKTSLRVNLTLKNHSNTAQQNVLLEDFIPTPLKLVKEFGTAHPALIKKVGGAVRVVWKFNTIYPGEERVVSYNMKSTLPVLGNIALPGAKVKAKINNQTKLYYSNAVSATGNVNISSDRGLDE
jgi:hypothetical protein